MLENIHQSIETYINDNMSLTPIKFSLTRRMARDFSLPDAPMLYDGVDNFVVFDVDVSFSGSASIGNEAKRSKGMVIVDIYVQSNTPDRSTYKIADTISSFLARQVFNGIIFRDVNKAGSYESGKWQVTTFTFEFLTTKMVN